jgi:hypothetical protein
MRIDIRATQGPVRDALMLPIVLLLLASSFSSRATGDTNAPDAESAVQSGGNALRSDDRFPWYDAEHDDLRPVVLRSYKDDGKNNSDDGRDSNPRHHGQSAHRNNSRGGNSSGRNRLGGNSSNNGAADDDNSKSQEDPPPSSNPSMPEVSAPWLIWVAWIVIGGVLVFLAVMLIRAFLNREARKAKASDGESIEAENDDDRLDALPLPAAPRRKGTLLEEARRSYEAGDYNAAIVYLYGYQLLKLDQNQWIRLAKGKTNRQYLRELSARGELQGVLARTMVPFEDVYFGSHALDRARFEACWNEVERFDRLVERASA